MIQDNSVKQISRDIILDVIKRLAEDTPNTIITIATDKPPFNVQRFKNGSVIERKLFKDPHSAKGQLRDYLYVEEGITEDIDYDLTLRTAKAKLIAI